MDRYRFEHIGIYTQGACVVYPRDIRGVWSWVAFDRANNEIGH